MYEDMFIDLDGGTTDEYFCKNFRSVACWLSYEGCIREIELASTRASRMPIVNTYSSKQSGVTRNCHK